MLDRDEALAVAQAVIRYHRGDEIDPADLESEIQRALTWANWVVFSKTSLELISRGELSITIDEGEREPRLFPLGETDEASDDEVADYLRAIDGWLRTQGGGTSDPE